MILGNVCTRNCRFCAVEHGTPEAPSADEPQRVAAAAQRLQLRYVVITSVTRDDLPDGGAGHFAATVQAVSAVCPDARVEVLVPDFGGRLDCIRRAAEAGVAVFNHNLETCRRLTDAIRSGADYDRSLAVLAAAAGLGCSGMAVKSGMMLGMGESTAEIHAMMHDLRNCGVSILTIGQYLSPSRGHWPVARYVEPAEFEHWRAVALEQYGFAAVASGPFVRSSYMADQTSAGL